MSNRFNTIFKGRELPLRKFYFKANGFDEASDKVNNVLHIIDEETDYKIWNVHIPLPTDETKTKFLIALRTPEKCIDAIKEEAFVEYSTMDEFREILKG